MDPQLLLHNPFEESDDRHALWVEPGWYFWDESQAYLLGPYETEDRAKIEASSYARYLNESKPDQLSQICRECDGRGAVDSGGETPWGQSIDIKCPTCDGTGKLEEPPK